jgi:hypothetical protein
MMKKTISIQNFKATIAFLWVVATLILLPGCSTEDSALTASEGKGLVTFTLGGITEGGEVSTTRAAAPTSETVVVPIKDGLAMACTMAADPTPKTRATTPMANGTKYRLVVYNNASEVVVTADYTVGEAVAPIWVPEGTYKVVAYSLNTSSLPVAGTSLNVSTSADLLYFSKADVVVVKNENTELPITFTRKFSKVKKVVVNSYGVGRDVLDIAGAYLGTHYDNAVMTVADGSLAKEEFGFTFTINLGWPGFNSQLISSNEITQVFFTGGDPINVQFPSIDIGGTTYTGKSATFSQALESGKTYTLTVRFSKCGAYVASGDWRLFMCYNLGADQTADPFTPSYQLNGAYIQWGKRGPNTTGDATEDWKTAPNDGPNGFAAAPTATDPNDATIAGWSTVDAPAGSWGATKTANDPCPPGYRVPTSPEWEGVADNNTVSRVGTWTESPTEYGSAVNLGSKLTLLAAGGIDSGGLIAGRGRQGYYMSVTEVGSNWISPFILGNSIGVTLIPGRTGGYSVRCIAE